MHIERIGLMEVWATQSKFRALVFLFGLGLVISGGMIGGAAALVKIAQSGVSSTAEASPR
jgi:hypothetical protein